MERESQEMPRRANVIIGWLTIIAGGLTYFITRELFPAIAIGIVVGLVAVWALKYFIANQDNPKSK